MMLVHDVSELFVEMILFLVLLARLRHLRERKQIPKTVVRHLDSIKSLPTLTLNNQKL